MIVTTITPEQPIMDTIQICQIFRSAHLTKRLKQSVRLTLIAFGLLNLDSVLAHEIGSNKRPLAFGEDQTIVDLSKIVWEPLQVDGLTEGAEIAVLRGDLEKGVSESLLRLPPNYVVPNHSHTSDELYVWIQGAFTLITHEGTETRFAGPAYISFPGNAPPHGLRCGPKTECVLYLRYSRPFDIKYFPEPTNEQSHTKPMSLPSAEQVLTINVSPDPDQTKEIFSPESLLKALPYFKPAYIVPPIGRKVWWQEGVMILKNGQTIPWKSFDNHMLAIEADGETFFYQRGRAYEKLYKTRNLHDLLDRKRVSVNSLNLHLYSGLALNRLSPTMGSPHHHS